MLLLLTDRHCKRDVTVWTLQTVLIVDTLTWGLLWPMLKATPDPSKLEFFTNQLFNFTSYNQASAIQLFNFTSYNEASLLMQSKA